MRLTKLELNGFKSFAHKTELQFAGGVTAVIGPNGSGKSNIADAVRWVLGEQSAKALRGSKMEDVIFSGTQTKKAQAYCEVTLTFDNSDGKLPVDFSEVAITRRVYRSGESEYCLNGNNCRLRDIQNLFHDTGIGKDGYSIIGQGRVDEILANKSNERRAALEEAAGVMRYRVRKEEATRKLDNTEKNLERIEDIVRELAERLGPLEEQSRSAREFLRLRDTLRDDEINLFLYQYDKTGEKLAAYADTIAQLTREGLSADEAEQQVLTECADYEERVKALDASLTEQQNALIALLSGVEARVGECNVLLERREHTAREKQRIAGEKRDAESRVQALSETLSGLRDDRTDESMRARLDAETAEAERQSAAADQAILEAEEALEAMKNSIIEAMNRLSDAKSRLSHFDAMSGAFRSRLETVAAELEQEKANREELERELAEADAAHAGQAKKRADAASALTGAEENRRALAETLAAREKERQALEQAAAGVRSRLRVLSEMAKSREGYYASVKNLMRDAEQDRRLGDAVVGVVAELIRVPKTYEQAVTMALGSALQNIVTRSAEDAQYVIEHLRRNDYGRATLLPMSILRINPLSRNERAFLNADGVCGVGNELVTCDEKIRDAVDYLLGRTVIVRDLTAGVALKKRSGGAFHIATLEGDIISTGGSMSGGSQQKRGFSLLGREREIEELGKTLSASEKRLAALLSDMEQNKRDILLADTQVAAFRDALHAEEIAFAKEDEQRGMILRDVDRSKEKRDTLLAERQQLEDNLADLVRERDEATAQKSDIETGNAATRDDVLRAQAALTELKKNRDAAYETLTGCRMRRVAFDKEQDAALRERKRLEGELAEAERTAARCTETAAALAAQAETLEKSLAELQSSVAGEQTEADAQKRVQQETENERAKLSEALTAARERREALLREARDRADRLHRQELLKNRTELELTAMQDHIWEEYQLTYENALPYRHEIAVGAANARIAETKAAIRALGDVNVSAIEDYQNVFDRHASLSAQCLDLRKAKADLEALIVDLTKTMQTEFSKQFAVIQKNFSDVFLELFGGGQAELRLADKQDVLNCDIDIIAQPPGKKLQMLSLMSGGERALTAIALLFALLRLKPPAFCVLDEIESSLDEANVSRFADFLKDYSDETQFIIITHRKGSMEVCDSLYGVSMEERGISKVVSARFGEGA